MSYGRVRCQVLETPASEDWMPRGADWPRDLLPWADPYIATIMVRLERRYDWLGHDSVGNDWVGEPEADDPFSADPFAADDAPLGFFPFGEAVIDNDAWQDADAFMPGWQEGPRRSHFPPVYGGFPLLDDVTDGLEEDPV
jgi:hypothetical protein